MPLRRNVRFGSLADIREHIGDVRFTPESRHTDSDNGSVAAVCFPHAPIGLTCALKRVTSIPPILHDGCCHSGREGARASTADLGYEKAPGMLNPEALVQFCGLPWSPPHRSEFKRAPRRYGISTVGTNLL